MLGLLKLFSKCVRVCICLSSMRVSGTNSLQQGFGQKWFKIPVPSKIWAVQFLHTVQRVVCAIFCEICEWRFNSQNFCWKREILIFSRETILTVLQKFWPRNNNPLYGISLMHLSNTQTFLYNGSSVIQIPLFLEVGKNVKMNTIVSITKPFDVCTGFCPNSTQPFTVRQYMPIEQSLCYLNNWKSSTVHTVWQC